MHWTIKMNSTSVPQIKIALYFEVGPLLGTTSSFARCSVMPVLPAGFRGRNKSCHMPVNTKIYLEQL